VSGTVVAVNDALADTPELVNSGPYEGGWMLEVRLAEGADGGAGVLAGLLDPTAYRDLTGS
jgi:glycine cleavage system H protein